MWWKYSVFAIAIVLLATVGGFVATQPKYQMNMRYEFGNGSGGGSGQALGLRWSDGRVNWGNMRGTSRSESDGKLEHAIRRKVTVLSIDQKAGEARVEVHLVIDTLAGTTTFHDIILVPLDGREVSFTPFPDATYWITIQPRQ